MTRPARAVPELSDVVLDWYDRHARDLPWRRPGTGAWPILVSEIMLQQTPVARVLPVWETWIARWPTPAALAAASAGEAVRAWGKLGYPRRALRLHEAAQQIVSGHGGEVPAELEQLLALPGVGSYTARAVASFAYGQRHPVVDTNVRRLVTRAVTGLAEPGPPSLARDLAAIEALIPAEPARAARFAVAAMELGALICTARSPACGQCPLLASCAWQLAGRPAPAGPRARRQGFTGTDRQVRGLLLDVLRGSPDPVPAARLEEVWPEVEQRKRSLAGLIADGLIQALPGGWFTLPG